MDIFVWVGAVIFFLRVRRGVDFLGANFSSLFGTSRPSRVFFCRSTQPELNLSKGLPDIFFIHRHFPSPSPSVSSHSFGHLAPLATSSHLALPTLGGGSGTIGLCFLSYWFFLIRRLYQISNDALIIYKCTIDWSLQIITGIVLENPSSCFSELLAVLENCPLKGGLEKRKKWHKKNRSTTTKSNNKRGQHIFFSPVKLYP